MSKPSAGPERPPVHVVAAVLEDLRGRILLTRRTADRDFAGLWEFPGGKAEPGESATEALARELHEELGIAIGEATPLIRIPCAHRSKRLLLDVHTVAGFTGRPHGREGQAIAWVPKHRLTRYAMPPADRPVVAAVLLPALALVTPEPDPADLDTFLHSIIEATTRYPATSPRRSASHARPTPPGRAYDALLQTPGRANDALLQTPGRGNDAQAPGRANDAQTSGRAYDALLQTAGNAAATPLLLQLRCKTLGQPTRRALAERLRTLLPAHVLLTINSDIETARALRSGLHLTSTQLHAHGKRPVPQSQLLGASCHTLHDLQQAQALGVDYAFLGPVAATATHPDTTPMGWPSFYALREQVTLPIYAIGGLHPDDLAHARHRGAQGIAAIRAFQHVLAPSPG